MNSTQRDELAVFQAALLDLLSEGRPPEETLRRLRADAAFAAHQDYIATFEPRMVEVATALVKKWGRREHGSRPDS